MKCYIIFQNSDLNILQFLKNGFRHCDIILENGIAIEITRSKISYGIVNINTIFDKIKKDSIIIIEYNIKNTEYSLLGVRTCVGICKEIIGITDFFIFTPYQLYKKLLKTGGKIWERQ